MTKGDADMNAKNYYDYPRLWEIVAQENERHHSRQDEKLVQLENGTSEVKISDKKGNTPLHYAWSTDSAKMLIEAGAEVNAVNSYGHTALHTAVFEHKIEIIKLLIDAGADVNAKDNEGITPYMLAYKKDEIDLLLAAGADQEEETRFVNRIIALGKNLNTLEFCAGYCYGFNYTCKNVARIIHLVKSAKNLKKLIDLGADVNAAYKKNTDRINYVRYDKLRPIHLAIESENTEALMLLIDSGADLDVCYHKYVEDEIALEDLESNIPPLAMALKNNCAKIVEILINAGADVSGDSVFGWGIRCIEEYDHTPIMEDAIKYADSGCLEMLRAARADINYRGYGCTLHRCFKEKFLYNKDKILAVLSIAKVLIKNGADVNAQDDEDKTPLHLVAYGNDEFTRLLIEHGANANIKDKHGKTPLHVCFERDGFKSICKKKLATAKLLIENGANINAQDNEGKTPLHLAYGNDTFVQFLIEHGADVNIKDNDGKNPKQAWEQKSKGAKYSWLYHNK